MGKDLPWKCGRRRLSRLLVHINDSCRNLNFTYGYRKAILSPNLGFLEQAEAHPRQKVKFLGLKCLGDCKHHPNWSGIVLKAHLDSSQVAGVFPCK